MNENKLICVDCGGEFSLTDLGKEIYKENNMGTPRRCLQCSIIVSRNNGEEPKNMDSLLKTSSTYWTKEKVDEYNLKMAVRTDDNPVKKR